jgi:hypothetical protein
MGLRVPSACGGIGVRRWAGVGDRRSGAGHRAWTSPYRGNRGHGGHASRGRRQGGAVPHGGSPIERVLADWHSAPPPPRRQRRHTRADPCAGCDCGARAACEVVRDADRGTGCSLPLAMADQPAYSAGPGRVAPRRGLARCTTTSLPVAQRGKFSPSPTAALTALAELLRLGRGRALRTATAGCSRTSAVNNRWRRGPAPPRCAGSRGAFASCAPTATPASSRHRRAPW